MSGVAQAADPSLKSCGPRPPINPVKWTLPQPFHAETKTLASHLPLPRTTSELLVGTPKVKTGVTLHWWSPLRNNSGLSPATRSAHPPTCAGPAGSVSTKPSFVARNADVSVKA